jgi:hypothetical protein
MIAPNLTPLPLIPAQARIQKERADFPVCVSWVPALAGTSGRVQRVKLDETCAKTLAPLHY